MVECTICSMIWEKIKNYFMDMTKIFGPLFIKNRYHLHMGLSFLLTVPSILFMMFFMNLDGTGLPFQVFLGGFGAFGVNFIRELIYEEIYKAPYDRTDVNMGSYGGLLGALVAVYIYTLL